MSATTTDNLKSLTLEFKDLVEGQINLLDDPIDKIAKMQPFIKKVLESHNVSELVLASPMGPEIEFEKYETDDNWLGASIFDAIEAYVNDSDPEFEWWEPIWVAYKDSKTYEESGLSLYYESNDEERHIVVRLGIVDGVVKFTRQDVFYDSNYKSTINKESGWLRLENVANDYFWLQLIVILLTKKEVWEYNEKYSKFHKLK